MPIVFLLGDKTRRRALWFRLPARFLERIRRAFV
jgi:hypothetical protein